MQAAAFPRAVALVAMLAFVAIAPGAMAADPLEVPLPVAVPVPHWLRDFLASMPDPGPVTDPAAESVALLTDVVDAVAGDTVDDTLAFTALFQDRFDELRAITAGTTTSLDGTVHGCPSGAALPSVDPNGEIPSPTSLDPAGMVHATDPWTAAPGTFVNDESACRGAQVIQAGQEASAEVFATHLPA